MILSVKSGKVSVRDLRDLRGVVEREKAQIGVLITLSKPTRPMEKEAANAGFYESPWTRRAHQRIQILTIEDLLDGRGIDYPASAAAASHRRAQRHEEKAENLSLGI